MRVYYAHSMQIYNTEREKNELQIINTMFDKTICPNNDIGKTDRGMRVYLKIVEWADLIIVSEYCGYVGCGVYYEIKTAIEHNILVKCLRKNKLYDIEGLSIYDSNDLKIKYAKLKIKK